MQLLGKYDNLVIYGDQTGFCDGRILESTTTLKLKLDHLDNSVEITSNLHGEYNINNILAAACTGLDNDLSVEQIKTGIRSS